MRRSWGCLCLDEVIAVVKIDRILAAPRPAGPSHKHRRAWNRIRPCSDDAPAECPGLLDAGPKPGPDRGVRSVVYRRAHGSAHFHAADLDRRLGGAGGGHGGRSAWFRHPYRGGAPAVHPVWAVRRDGDAARADFLDFDKKAIDGLRKSVTIHLARDGAALTRKMLRGSADGEYMERRGKPQRSDRVGTSGSRQNRPTTASRCRIVLHTAI